MRKLWAVALKEVRQIRRDPYTLTMLLAVPAFMLLIYGYALNFDVRHVAMAVQDRDQSAESRELIASFVNSTYFDRVMDAPPGTDLEAITEKRFAKIILVIPEGFGADVRGGGTGHVQALLDGSDANTASTVLGYAMSLAADASARLVAGRMRGSLARRAQPLSYEPRVWYNPELRSTNFLVPGLMGFILMLTAVLSTALSVVREKERGTMEQLRVTSLRPAQLILGKALPYLGISLTAASIIVLAARVLFGVAVQGSYADLFLVTLIYLIGALSWGLLVSSFSWSQSMAFQIGTLSSMLPAIFLSGFIFPIRSMPVVLQWATYAFPARYFLIVVRGIMLKGAGLAPYWEQMLFLVLYASLVLLISYVRLSREGAAA